MLNLSEVDDIFGLSDILVPVLHWYSLPRALSVFYPMPPLQMHSECYTLLKLALHEILAV